MKEVKEMWEQLDDDEVVLGNDIRNAHTAKNAEALLKVLVSDLEVMEEVQASGVKRVRRVRRSEESEEGGQIVLGDGCDHHAERQVGYTPNGTHDVKHLWCLSHGAWHDWTKLCVMFGYVGICEGMNVMNLLLFRT